MKTINSKNEFQATPINGNVLGVITEDLNLYAMIPAAGDTLRLRLDDLVAWAHMVEPPPKKYDHTEDWNLIFTEKCRANILEKTGFIITPDNIQPLTMHFASIHNDTKTMLGTIYYNEPANELVIHRFNNNQLFVIPLMFRDDALELAMNLLVNYLESQLGSRGDAEDALRLINDIGDHFDIVDFTNNALSSKDLSREQVSEVLEALGTDVDDVLNDKMEHTLRQGFSDSVALSILDVAEVRGSEVIDEWKENFDNDDVPNLLEDSDFRSRIGITDEIWSVIKQS